MHEEILFTPILGAHLLAGVGALTLAIVQVHFMSRGSKDHKKLGWVWAALMALWRFGWPAPTGWSYTAMR